MARLCVAAALVAMLTGGTARASDSWPTSKDALRWNAPSTWLKQAECIHSKEWKYSWHIHKVDYRGRRSSYSGGLQFLDDTWRRAGGTGSAGLWSKQEQLYRAWRIWSMGGGSWREWGTRRLCGL